MVESRAQFNFFKGIKWITFPEFGSGINYEVEIAHSPVFRQEESTAFDIRWI